MHWLNSRLLGDYARGGRGGDFRHAAERAPLDLELNRRFETINEAGSESIFYSIPDTGTQMAIALQRWMLTSSMSYQ